MYNGRERKLNRAKSIDYSLPGFYYLTFLTKNRLEWFGEIKNNKMVLNEWGKIVCRQLLWLEQQYDHVRLDEWIIMPNHVHVIVEILHASNPTPVRNGRDRSLQAWGDRDRRVQEKKRKPIPELIGALKTTSSKWIHRNGLFEFKWHKSYHDRVLRSQSELEHARWYIRTNPGRWHRDRNN
ncbi:transposase [Candidatus Kuenenbacteria bacterium]|nr:transposase [Candidatus Kuenenbacteria bacterium]